MAKKNRVDVSTFFSEVDQGQEVHSLRDEVSNLKSEIKDRISRETALIAEIESLKQSQNTSEQNDSLNSVVNELREHLEDSYGKVQFPVDKIYRNEAQPRQSFRVEVQSMQRSLETEGQLDPVILFSDGKLFDGECRWRAATNLGWGSLDAVFITDMDPKSLRRKAYLTSLHRQNLNALDRAEALIAIVCDNSDATKEEVPRILNRVLTRLKRQKLMLPPGIEVMSPDDQQKELDQLSLSVEEQSIFLTLLGLQETPTSLNRNIFPMLSLQNDLKESVREKGLPCPQALELNKISVKNKKLEISAQVATKLRRKGVADVINNSLSIAQTKKWVKENTDPYDSSQKAPETFSYEPQIQPILKRMSTLVQHLSFSEIHDEQINASLSKINDILSELENFKN